MKSARPLRARSHEGGHGQTQPEDNPRIRNLTWKASPPRILLAAGVAMSTWGPSFTGRSWTPPPQENWTTTTKHKKDFWERSRTKRIVTSFLGPLFGGMEIMEWFFPSFPFFLFSFPCVTLFSFPFSPPTFKSFFFL